jgi:DinB superfamily
VSWGPDAHRARPGCTAQGVKHHMTSLSPSRERTGRPVAGEFAAYAAPDIEQVLGDDAIEALAEQRDAVLALLSTVDDDAVDGVTYAPGKWVLKDVVAHLIDDERIFAYRLLCVARRDPRALEGFDEQQYANAAEGSRRSWTALLSDYVAVRQSTLTLLEGLPASAWDARGVVNGYVASVRGLAFHIAGHELRHLRSIQSNYWPRLRSPGVAR